MSFNHDKCFVCTRDFSMYFKYFYVIFLDVSTNHGWMNLIQGISESYYDNEVINYNTKCTSVHFFWFVFRNARTLVKGKDPLLIERWDRISISTVELFDIFLWWKKCFHIGELLLDLSVKVYQHKVSVARDRKAESKSRGRNYPT